MNRIKLIIFSFALLSLSLLFSVGQAEAQKPIPGIKTTAAYKSLVNYVNNTLAPRQSTPASSAQKTIYQNTLASRASTANSRVVSIYQQRRNRVTKQNKNKFNRAVAKVKVVYNKRVNKATKKYKRDLDRDERAYHQGISNVNAIFAKAISSIRSQISAQYKRLRKAKTGAQRAAIQANIDDLNTDLQRVLDRRSNAQNKVKRNYDNSDRKDYNTWQNSLAVAKTSFLSRKRLVRVKFNKLLRQNLQNALSLKASQHALVSQVRSRGEGYISSMPPVNE